MRVRNVSGTRTGGLVLFVLVVALAVLAWGDAGVRAADTSTEGSFHFVEALAGASGPAGEHVALGADCYGICLGSLAVGHGEGGNRLDVNGQLFALGGQCVEGDQLILAGVFLYFGAVDVGTDIPNPITGGSIPMHYQIPIPGVTTALITLHANGEYDLDFASIVVPSLTGSVEGGPLKMHAPPGSGNFDITCY